MTEKGKKYLNISWRVLMLCVGLSISLVADAQNQQKLETSVSYLNPKEYTIGEIEVEGAHFLDIDVLKTITQIAKGDRIIVPGETTSNVIKHLWAQGLFDDVLLQISRIQSDTIYFKIKVKELPRLSEIKFSGIRKGQIKELREKLDVYNGKVVNQNLRNTIDHVIRKFFYEKGFIDAEINMTNIPDANKPNQIILETKVKKNKRVRVHRVYFNGQITVGQSKLRGYLKKIKGPFLGLMFPSKFQDDKFLEAKEALVEKLNSQGYRDAKILKDTVYKVKPGRVVVSLTINEGRKYYFGDVTFSGNAKYSSAILGEILKIQKGDVYSDEKLSKRLTSSPNGDDVSSLYLNDGYLTFNAEPVQTRIRQDTVDLEIRIYEGPQFTINKVTLKGNELTNDRVIMREVRTKPGQKFSKELIVRTVREIAQLGMFDDQKTDVKPKPNPADGTVDIEYSVAEKPSDQIELSGGYGGYSITGSLGLTFNNFSIKNIFNKSSYRPLPKGDGQRLSLRWMSNGYSYQSVSASFSEPWFGGKRPIYFGVSLFTTLSSNYGYLYKTSNPSAQYISMTGGTISLGRRVKWPDDYFQLTNSLGIKQISLRNYSSVYLFGTGRSLDINLSQEISRNSIDVPIFPTSGSNLRFLVQATLPYSKFNGLNYEAATDQQRYQYTEYHKWKFDFQWFYRIAGKLVLKTQAQFGLLGKYTNRAPISPFERFLLGGDGMQYSGGIQSYEIIGLRGYTNGSVVPEGVKSSSGSSGSPVYDKFIMELRYPIVNSQQATVFVTTFAEGGNTWSQISQFSPFDVKRSVGTGVRVFLPIFGMIGLDYGYGFDTILSNPTANKGQFHFSITQQMGGFNN